ncbi:Acyl-phosphate:glycerol-3-phosphate O-acyltransferase PlsY (EC 2.3.1.n3) [uncultured Gammaproteobacteria bacterium]|uniref:glycerol-3-phosphate 1-O-acyltransferase PlsY n=1 Tax=Bathymodiolus heckerae thiotrophic gill symbiont TaxID=1052212 RepID=UPI0010B224FE|nr:glycerol-3-phosphate 1-O-acyltransferase PlsY [Bathymodiolus heckerae thiotrophic gill symbiont]CAC9603629.1 Acyl-phosphate:glycerol-3-phosphate O-acyltransferase PlsY (EC 2.3.1.n3) [uncultured Gammaproteobacteria bacterium]SHN89410.1 Acyl-phosphate:glycerol-3-phosphate O-acyltransferase PlsY [Bathymodiolus heckerae thiotrophic gill symbiont]
MLPEFSFAIILSYLIGSISTAILVCKALNLPDPRTQGSNNPGATNVLRIGGKKAAAITLVGDGLKGALPVLLAVYMGFDLVDATWIALAAFLGHVYPVFFSFKGGKGVATFLGALFALGFTIGASFTLIWVFVAKVLKISSLSALIATLLTPVFFFFLSGDLKATYIICLMSLWILYTHRSNIKRMISGEEDSIKS